MQRWYNNLTKGQKYTLGGGVFAATFCIVALLTQEPVVGVIIGAVASLPILFLKLGNKE